MQKVSGSIPLSSTTFLSLAAQELRIKDEGLVTEHSA